MSPAELGARVETIERELDRLRLDVRELRQEASEAMTREEADSRAQRVTDRLDTLGVEFASFRGWLLGGLAIVGVLVPIVTAIVLKLLG